MYSAFKKQLRSPNPHTRAALPNHTGLRPTLSLLDQEIHYCQSDSSNN